VLNITPQYDAAGAKSYFAKSDYYSEGQEIVGQWGGKGAVLLGLFGQVDKAVFESLCDNRNPQTKQPLTPMTREERRVGYDFTWSAPKSVSLVHALTGDERIVQAFRDSIDQTMKEMEAEMQTRVRRAGAQEDRTTGNMLWAEFVHLTSRPVDGLPDPQLHAHLFCFNATFDREEDTWKAGQYGKIKEDGYYWQAVQQSRFAQELQKLGYGIRRTKDAFEIAGVPQTTLRKFSRRSDVIDKLAEELGITDPERKAKLAATTREAKDNTIPYPDLVERWDGMLDRAERIALGRARGKVSVPADRSGEHLAFAVGHLFERSSVIAERRLLTEALRHGVGETTPERLREAASGEQLLRRSEDGVTWVTTPQVLAEERHMLATARAGRDACRPILAKKPKLLDQRLNDGQRRAVEHLLNSPDRIMILRGFAGTGKTTLTREAVAHMEQAGKPVVMLAPSAQASRGVLRDEGFAAADTLTKFLDDPTMQLQARGGVIWLDEAGLVGTRSMAAVLQVAEQQNARVVLAGDKRQLASVERGSPLRVLEELGGLKVAEVTDIRRQSGKYREAANLLARGETAAGLEVLDRLGWVKQMPKPQEYAPLATDYLNAVNQKESVLVVSPTHVEGAKVTQEIRTKLREAGRLGSDEHELIRLVPLHWTEAQRGDKQQYSGDELLQFHRKAGVFLAGERLKASDVLPQLTEKVARSTAAYGETTIRLAAGDTVRITANGKTKDGAHRLNNGEVFTVKQFTRDGDLVDHRGWVIGKDFGHLAYGYVSTSHAAQGRTVDRVLIAQSAMSYPAASRENFYVAVTRGRKSATIYTDDKEELAKAIKRSHPRRSATELIDGRRQPVDGRPKRRFSVIRRAMIAARRIVRQPERHKHRELDHAR
jgi:conjugative relaxase-like TrwC/TraI family protein